MFDDCEVPEENVMGPVNGGVGVLMSGLDYERVVLAGLQLGIMQACLDTVIPYLRERKQFGKPIGSFQLMQAKVADMYVALQSARAYTYAVAKACDAGKTTRFDAAGAILLASENAFRVAGEAVQALGGAGYTQGLAGRTLSARCQAARHRCGNERNPAHADRPRTDRSGWVSAPVLTSQLDRESAESKARFAHNKSLADELRAKVAEAALGGPEKHRGRHVARGKLLPRERVERLLDPGSPLLEIGQLAANGMYEGDVNGASMICGDRPRVRAAGDDRVQRSDREGRLLLPDDGQEASASAGNCAGKPSAVHLSGRQRRGQPALSGGGIPRPRPFRADLLQPGEHVRSSASRRSHA